MVADLVPGGNALGEDVRARLDELAGNEEGDSVTILLLGSTRLSGSSSQSLRSRL